MLKLAFSKKLLTPTNPKRGFWRLKKLNSLKITIPNIIAFHVFGRKRAFPHQNHGVKRTLRITQIQYQETKQTKQKTLK